MARLTQTAVIEKHLIEHGSISGKQAMDLYGIYRLSEVIRKLRDKGLVIHTIMNDTTTKLGIETRYGVYIWDSVKNMPFYGSAEDEQ